MRLIRLVLVFIFFGQSVLLNAQVKHAPDSFLIKENAQMWGSRYDGMNSRLNALKIEIAITKTENQALKERLSDQNSWINVWTAIF